MKLSEKVTERRTDRLDEWSMDDLSNDIANLEAEREQAYLAVEEINRYLNKIHKDNKFNKWFDAEGKAMRSLSYNNTSIGGEL